jgi:hypothetical protein
MVVEQVLAEPHLVLPLPSSVNELAGTVDVVVDELVLAVELVVRVVDVEVVVDLVVDAGVVVEETVEVTAMDVVVVVVPPEAE